MLSIEPTRVAVEPAVLADLRERIARTRWPDEPPGAGWTYGVDPGWLRGILDRWRSFDWPAFERRLNELPHYRARIGEYDLHFVHVRGAGPDPLPLVLTHGWPGSFLEYLELIPLLADPEDPADAFDVVVPSLPGFGLSAPPRRPGVTNAVVADLWHRLMTDGLGYPRYGAHGSDIGAGVTGQLGLRHPGQLAGIHLSAFALPAPPLPWSDAERRYLGEIERWHAAEGGYLHQQATRPATLGYALADSPAGLAAWLLEKYRDWSDGRGAGIARDRLLATLTLYWATNTIASSARMYHDNRHHGAPLPPTPIPVPAGFALFPHESRPVPSPPRDLAARYFTVAQWREHPRGGHFPALEQPHLLAEDLRAFFGGVRQ